MSKNSLSIFRDHVYIYSIVHAHVHTHLPCHTHSTLTALTSRMDKLEESLLNFSLRSEKIEDTLRSWTPHGRTYTGTGSGGTPVIRERTNREKRWSIESTTSLASTHDNMHTNNHKPFVWQMPFTVKCIGTFRLVLCVKIHV